MSTVTLLVKAYNNFQLKLVDKFLKSTLKGLKIEIEVCEVIPHQWVQINISGEDEKVGLRYLADEIGLCPTRLEHVEKFTITKGRIITTDKNEDALHIDIGVFTPKIIDAIIPLRHLRAQLVNGRKLTIEKIVELFGFRKNLPLSVKILNVDKEKNRIEAMLSEKQLIQYRNWTKSLLDRLIVLGAPIPDVTLALKEVGLNRDVLNIEPLGLFELAVTCKLGTDAAGLIPKLGRSLRNATFTVFSPKKVPKLLDYSTAFIC
jgi:hypothetical protein